VKRVPVIFENDACLVLNKPAGLAVQGGKGVKVSLDSLLAESYTERPLLVHRLDKDTSGLILTAKNGARAAFFSGLFRNGRGGKERKIRKLYLAVVLGVPRPASGLIKSAIMVRGRSLNAETSFDILYSSKAGGYDFSLLELELGTGRMHQIRRHLAGIGHPVLGDDKYGDFSLNKKLRKELALKRLLLHAFRLSISPCPPLFQEGLDLEAPPPDYFAPFLPAHGGY
jgi:23S rRNA pseudouridine955/2504/2580 synthase